MKLDRPIVTGTQVFEVDLRLKINPRKSVADACYDVRYESFLSRNTTYARLLILAHAFYNSSAHKGMLYS